MLKLPIRYNSKGIDSKLLFARNIYYVVACSRLLDCRVRRSVNTKIKREETEESAGGGACNHFFKRPVPVYHLLVYPLIGQI